MGQEFRQGGLGVWSSGSSASQTYSCGPSGGSQTASFMCLVPGLGWLKELGAGHYGSFSMASAGA